MTTLEGLQDAFGGAQEDVWLHFVLVEHVDLAQPLRFVANGEDVTQGGEVWTGVMFEIDLPKGGGGKGAIRVPNVDRAITDTLRTLINKSEADMTMFVCRSSALNVIEYGPIFMKLANVEWDAMYVSGTLTIGDFLKQSVPADTFNNVDYPAILPG
tara:strand:- start:5079 stop:5546 length:468 start_codon:yes stop_codon:yes gene_type:complete